MDGHEQVPSDRASRARGGGHPFWGAQMSAAARFQVGTATVTRWWRRWRTTGSVAPAPHGGGMPPLIPDGDLHRVRALVEEDSDATLQRLCDRYTDGFGIPMNQGTMSRALDRAEVSRKEVPLRLGAGRATRPGTDRDLRLRDRASRPQGSRLPRRVGRPCRHDAPVCAGAHRGAPMTPRWRSIDRPTARTWSGSLLGPQLVARTARVEEGRSAGNLAGETRRNVQNAEGPTG